MAKLTMKRAHGGTSLDEGKERIRRVMTEMKPTLDKFVKRIEWSSDETMAKLKGKHVKGTFSVDESHILINLDLSFAASLIKGKIESRIDSALKQNL